jgi:hypothetical protein
VSRTRSSHRRRRQPNLQECSPSRGIRTPEILLFPRLAAFCARGLGAVRGDNAQWEYQSAHGPPQGRVPLQFFARVLSPPATLTSAIEGSPALRGPLVSLQHLKPGLLVAPSLAAALSGLSPLATPMLVFVGSSKTAVLPDTLHDNSSATAAAEALYWALVSTDSCEAVHCGVLLAIRRLAALHGAEISMCDERGVPIVDWGMHTVERVKPFERMLKVSRATCTRCGSGDGGEACPARLRMECDPPAVAAHGGTMHQLVWLRSADGRESVCDFTGPQYGITERLAETGSPFWSCDVSGEGGGVLRSQYGFELVGEPASFSHRRPLPEAVLSNSMHARIAIWARDSTLGVMANVGAIVRANDGSEAEQ